MLTIVAYHYVRDLPRSRFPEFKGLLTKKFEGQLDYITKHYTVCGVQQVIAAVRGEDELPPNPCVLTFDDGFIDHFVTVFPILEERGLIGSFYPPGKVVLGSHLLNSHKIHYILASALNHSAIVRRFLELIKPYRTDFNFPDDEELYRTCAVPGSDDDGPDTVFLKRAQHVLPEEVRSVVLSQLLGQFVDQDEATLAKETYMDLAQLRTMVRHGMEIGGHGHNHVRLGQLPREEQKEELRGTVECLASIYGYRPSDWVMSFPFGGYDPLTIELVQEEGCALGLGVRADLVTDLSEPFELNRLDTNDIPFSGDSEICEWTKKALRSGTPT